MVSQKIVKIKEYLKKRARKMLTVDGLFYGFPKSWFFT